MKSFTIILFIIVIYDSSSGQVIKNEDLRGKWEINDMSGAHKNFRVVFTFEWPSSLREDINDTLVSYESYRLSTEEGKSALVFVKFDTAAKELSHPLNLKGDTLTIGNFYYPYKPGYGLVRGDSIYFIRSRGD